MIISDDIISDVISPGSTIREDRIDAPYGGTLCSSIVQFWRELPEKKHFKEKSVTSPLWRHPVTWRHREHAQSIAHRLVYIGYPLEPSRYLASFSRYLAPKLQTDRTNDRTKDRQTREVNIRVAKAECSRTNTKQAPITICRLPSVDLCSISCLR